LATEPKQSVREKKTVNESRWQKGTDTQSQRQKDTQRQKLFRETDRLNYRVVHSRNFIQLLLRNCHRDSQIQGTNSTVYRDTHLQSQKCKQGYTKSKEEKTQNSKVERDTQTEVETGTNSEVEKTLTVE